MHSGQTQTRIKPEPDGQILLDSEFGKFLTALARQSTNIVELGTWNGGGSTLCLANGLERPEQRLFTVEADNAMHATAKARYDDPRIIFLNGTVSPMNDAPLVLSVLPEAIDLLLIDGGDGNGASDFEALWHRCAIIALDDSNEQKNLSNHAFLFQRDWKLIAGSASDRNGWAIFKRPEK